ncbi:DUF763 domain-containing protein [Methanothermobacter sp.]|uniref:DUF763 domain-containing protein n=1 Tax=Methanothermobacter sp. TaxID=1884223 RepID=UPI0026348B6A|nr:DUF763 domain-containing protein [Methanothermobacter sp.]MDI9615524.1 DUF763 domain-containing protein [Methanothermobacter sp.]
MRRTGIANLPLHGGHPPAWLMRRMVELSGAIAEVIIEEYGTSEFISRISDPFWFQAFSCTIGFDWHSSGTTTTTCGALKSALDPERHGILVAGGKGRASRRTPGELEAAGKLFDLDSHHLVYSSRIAARVDGNCIQDGFSLYQHTFLVDADGEWAVVQQGLNPDGGYARRYHWLGSGVGDYVDSPHSGISSDKTMGEVLDMTSPRSRGARDVSVDIVCDGPSHIRGYLTGQRTLFDFNVLDMPGHHEVLPLDLTERDMAVLERAYEIRPGNYEELVMVDGLGPKKIRALALVADLVYGEEVSWRDPVKYSYAHGGKDGYPYPVDRDTYDSTVDYLKGALEEARIDRKDRLRALESLERFLRF